MNRLRAIAAIGFAMIGSVAVSACGGGGDGRGRDATSAAPLAADCGVALPSFPQTVYVSTRGNDAVSGGAASTTVSASIDKGIAACAGAGCVVLVRHGLYRTTATIALRGGVSIYGGFRFDGPTSHANRRQPVPVPPEPAACVQQTGGARWRLPCDAGRRPCCRHRRCRDFLKRNARAGLWPAAVMLVWLGAIGVATPVAATRHANAAPTLAAATLTCPSSPSTAAGKNFRGQTLTLANFSRLGLRTANFRGAGLKGASFIGANLIGADFSGPNFVDSGSAARPADFMLATLDSACFIGATFTAPTCFTYAPLTCTDFSATDLRTGNLVLGVAPLRYLPPAVPSPC